MSQSAPNIEHLSPVAEVSMADDWFEIASEDHFWMQWRFQIYQKYFDKHIAPDAKVLEIGCGNAVFRDQLESIGYTVDGCDLNGMALSMAKDGKGRLMVYDIFDRNKELIGQYDLVIMMDVIEHITDHEQFLKVALEHLKPGGKIVMNVPANMWLFSKYDTAAGHIRRYVKSTMGALMESADLDIIDMRYWGGIMMPIAVARKIMLNFISEEKIIKDGFKPPSEGVHKMLKGLKNVEVGMPFSLFTGTSLMVIGELK